MTPRQWVEFLRLSLNAAIADEDFASAYLIVGLLGVEIKYQLTPERTP